MRLCLIFFFIFVSLTSFTSATSNDCLDIFPLVEQNEIDNTVGEAIYDMTWLPNTNCLLLASSQGIQIIDANNVIEHAFIAIGDMRSIAVNSTGTQVTYVFYEGTEAYILDTEGDTKEIPVNRLVTDLIFLSNQNNLAIATTEIFSVDMPIQINAQIHVWNVETIQEISILETDAGWITTLDNMSGDKLLSVGYNNGFPQAVVQTWDLNNSEPVWEYFDIASELMPSDSFDPFMIQIAITRNNVIVGGGIRGFFNLENYYGYGIQVWNASLIEPISEIPVFNSDELRSGLRITDVVLSSDAEIVIATSSTDIFVWNVATGELILQSNIGEGAIQQIELSPDDSRLAINIASDDGDIVNILNFNTLDISGTVDS